MLQAYNEKAAATGDVWGAYFKDGYNPESYTDIRVRVDDSVAAFLKNITDPDTGALTIADMADGHHAPHLDKWVESRHGQTMLYHLVLDIQSHISRVEDYAMPAHDIRQILFKDASEALRFYQMEQPGGYRSAFVIPTFSHDIGRLLEGRFFHPDNPHNQWIPHAKFSFVLLDNILGKDDYADMPRDLKNHFLYAVLAHSGENAKTYMARAVQACDRMQLIGPEGFFRASAYGLCLLQADIKYPEGDTCKTDLPVFGKHHSVLSELEFFARNMRPNIGTRHRDEWQHRIAVENVALLLKASERTETLRHTMFFPEYNTDITAEYGPAKRPIKGAVFHEALNLAENAFGHIRANGVGVDDAAHALRRSLTDIHGAASLNPEMDHSIWRAVSVIPRDDLCALYDAIMMADALRLNQDRLDCHYAQQCTSEQHPFFVRAVAKHTLAHAPQSNDKLVVISAPFLTPT